MAEKQYKVGYFDDPNDVDSYVENSDGEYLDATDVVKLLNKLSEENKELKKENEHIETCFKMADSTYHALQKQYQNIEIALSKYRKENEQLKQDRDEMFIRERDARNELRDIKNENEQLKNEIKMLKSTIARNEAYITRLTKKGKWTK